METKPKENKGIPVMITRDMEMRLLKMGFGVEEINKLTPQGAWDILENKKRSEETPIETAVKKAELITDEHKKNVSLFEVGKNAIKLGNFVLSREIVKKMSTESQYLRYSLAREIAKKTKDLGDFKEALVLAEEGIKLDEEDEKKYETALNEGKFHERRLTMDKLSIPELAIWAARAKMGEFANEVVKRIEDPTMMARFAAEVDTILKTGKGTWTEEGHHEGIKELTDPPKEAPEPVKEKTEDEDVEENNLSPLREKTLGSAKEETVDENVEQINLSPLEPENKEEKNKDSSNSKEEKQARGVEIEKAKEMAEKTLNHVVVGSTILYQRKKYEIVQMPNKENENTYVILPDHVLSPLPRIKGSVLLDLFEKGEATLVSSVKNIKMPLVTYDLSKLDYQTREGIVKEINDFTNYEPDPTEVSAIEHKDKNLETLLNNPIIFFRKEMEEEKRYLEYLKKLKPEELTPEEIKKQEGFIGRISGIIADLEKNGPVIKTPEAKEEIGVQPETEKETEIQKEIEKLTPKEREKISWGLGNIGFKVEKAKNDFFAKLFDPKTDILLSKLEKKGTAGRFFRELHDSFVRDSEMAAKKAQGRGIRKQLSDKLALTSNVLKYGRMVTDLTGASLASPFRYVMMGGMATARIAEAGKEARLKNEEVIEKTRIADAEKAAEEAWKIYENAQKKEGAENVSTQAINNAYLMAMPKDLLERIERDPGVASGLIQRAIKKDLAWTIKNLTNKVSKIENDSKLNPEEKEEKIQELLTKQKKNLEDYDRIITQYGTVDELAMAARYTQTTGRAIVIGMQIETIERLAVPRLTETIYGIFHHNHEALTTSHALHVGTTEHTQGHISGSTSPSEQIRPGATIKPESISVVHKGEGIEHAFRRQIEHDESLAKALGFKGDIHDTKALHEFSGGAAHRLAIDTGYVDKTGAHQIGITQANKVSFEVKMENGQPIVVEKALDGKILGTHEHGYEFGKDSQNPYEKEFNTPQHETTMPAETTTSSAYHPTEPNTAIDKAETPEGVIRKMEAGDKSLPNEAILAGDEHRAADIVSSHNSAPYEPSQEIKNMHERALHNEIMKKMENGDPSLPNEKISPENAQGFSGSSFEEKKALLLHDPYFSSNPYGLNESGAWTAYETSQNNIKFLYGDNSSSIWNHMKGIPAQLAMEKTWENDPNLRVATMNTGRYLRLLEQFSHLRPRRMFLGIVPETTNSYVSFAIQKITSEGKLEEFEQSLKNIIR